MFVVLMVITSLLFLFQSFLLFGLLSLLLNLLKHVTVFHLESQIWDEVLIQVFQEDESCLLEWFNTGSDEDVQIVLIK